MPYFTYSPRERWEYAKKAEAKKIKDKGFGEKYDHAGIYCIKLNGKVVYVGQSHNMLLRIAEHILKINLPDEHKYIILNEAKDHCNIEFDVLYNVKYDFFSDEDQQLNEKEAEYIAFFQPPLNTQIPDGKGHWKVNENA